MRNGKSITSTFDELEFRRNEIRNKLMSIELKGGIATSICGGVGYSLNISAQTVKNYLAGAVNDGYLAEAIYKEFKRIGMTK